MRALQYSQHGTEIGFLCLPRKHVIFSPSQVTLIGGAVRSTKRNLTMTRTSDALFPSARKVLQDDFVSRRNGKETWKQ